MTKAFDERLADQDAGIELDGPELIHDGYRKLERWRATLPAAGERGEVRQTREVLRAGPCIGAICVDTDRDLMVLIRQFRLPAALATGKGDLVEIVAGRVESGEDLSAAVVREIEEETSLVASKVVELFGFLPTPGIIDESATMFLAKVSAGSLPTLGGAPNENELTKPFTISLDEAIASLDDPRPRNAYLLLALQWLALNRERIQTLLSSAR